MRGLVVQKLALAFSSFALLLSTRACVPKFRVDRSRLRSYWSWALISSASSMAMLALVRSTSA